MINPNAKVLGVTDTVVECDCCGKKNLKVTVIMEVNGELVHYGRDCAARTLFGKTSKKIVQKIENEGKALVKIAPVVEAVKSAMKAGYDRENVIREGNLAAKGIMINGMPVDVGGGFESWGFFAVYWNGGSFKIPL